MQKSARKNSHKALASVALVAAAAGVAGLGTFGSFTSTTSANQSVDSGTVVIALGANGTAANRFDVAATNIVAGDTIQRAVELKNTGSADFSTITLTTAATPTNLLTTDTNGLKVKIDSCATAWTETGTAPAYTYTCAGSSSSVLSERPIVGANMALSSSAALQASKTAYLRVTTTLPTEASNTLQGLSSVTNFKFDATQRTAGNR